MMIVCGHRRETLAEREVIDLGGVGEIACLECSGSGVWDFMEPEIVADQCVQCKGTGKQLVGL